MTANNNSNQKQSAFENLKVLRSEAYKEGEELNKQIKSAKRKLDTIYSAISSKQKELSQENENEKSVEQVENASNQNEVQKSHQEEVATSKVVDDVLDDKKTEENVKPPKNQKIEKENVEIKVEKPQADNSHDSSKKQEIIDAVDTKKVETKSVDAIKVETKSVETKSVEIKENKEVKAVEEVEKEKNQEAKQQESKQTFENVEEKAEDKKDSSAHTKTAQNRRQQPAVQQPTQTQQSQTSEGIKTVEKTYVDEKGNVKVRRFVDVVKTYPNQRPQRDNRDNKDNNNRDNRYNRENRDNRDNRNSYNSGDRPNYERRDQRGGYNREGYNRDGQNREGYNRDGQNREGYNRDGQSRDGQRDFRRDGANKTFDRGERVPRKDIQDKDADTNNRHEVKKPAPKKPQFDIGIKAKEPNKTFGNKNKTPERNEDKKNAAGKKIKVRAFDEFDDDRVVNRKLNKKKDTKSEQIIPKKVERAVVSGEDISIKDLSEKIGVTASSIIKELFKENILKSINDRIEYSLAEYIAGIFNVTLEQKIEKTAEQVVEGGFYEDDGLIDDQKRPPIVTVMGHVDHGKTSLLDAIRESKVTEGEAGGITQHIGAYQVSINNEFITFIDTPGHEAFTAMRARGAQVTDIAIIVVAADDGVMPQTIEAINHAKAAEVPIIVAINKMDKPQANPDTVKTQLTEYGLVCESWGGDTIMVPVSAKAKMGIDELLESILIVAEVLELKANATKKAKGTVIEAKLDKGRGPVATLLIQNGTLRVGDYVVAGTAVGKIRAMFDNKGKALKIASPGTPAEVLGFSDVPNAGDNVYSVDEKLAKQVASERKDKERVLLQQSQSTVSLDDVFNRISEENMKVLNIIIKCDVQGTMEALKSSLVKVGNQEVRIVPIHGGVGAITETDVMLAKASNAIIIGFNVRADNNARMSAEKEGVDIRIYNIIYDAVDDIAKAMKGMLAPKFHDVVIGQILVREVFKIPGIGAIAGCYVTQGKITKSSKVRVYRNDVLVADCALLSLKRFKDDAKEVLKGNECGVGLVNFNDIKQDDIYEVYQTEEVEA